MEHSRPDADWLDPWIGQVTAAPLVGRGGAGMVIVVPHLASPRVERAVDAQSTAYVLVESGDGRPMGGTAKSADGLPPDPSKVNLQVVTGEWMALGWLGGFTAWSLHRQAQGKVVQEALSRNRALVEDGIARAVEAALPSCGFSDAFVEAMRCGQQWQGPPHGLDGILFRRDTTGASVSRFCLENPILSQVAFREVLRAGRDGAPIRVEDIAPGVDKARAARLSRADWNDRSRTAKPSIRELVLMNPRLSRTFLSLLGSIPPEWIPHEGPQVSAFMGTVQMLGSLGGISLDLPVLVRSSRGDWESFLSRCKAAMGDEWSPGNLIGYLGDPVADLANRIVLPLMARAGQAVTLPREDTPHPAVGMAQSLLYRDRSLPGCIEAARKWHDHLAAIQSAMPNDCDADDSGWPVPFEETVIDGTIVRALRTSREIEDEGAAGPDATGAAGLDHCVASYRVKASLGKIHIVSLRKPLPGGKYERLATAEFAQQPTGHLQLRQIQGMRNGDPPTEASRAIETLMVRAFPYVEPRPPGGDDPARYACGYDWAVPGLLAQACEAYAPMLPRGLRAGPDALSAALGINGPEGHLSK